MFHCKSCEKYSQTIPTEQKTPSQIYEDVLRET